MTTKQATPPFRITPAMLRAENAYCTLYLRFCRRWPTGVEVTQETAEVALRAEFPLWWATEAFLIQRGIDMYERTESAATDVYYAMVSEYMTPENAAKRRKMQEARHQFDRLLAAGFVRACRYPKAAYRPATTPSTSRRSV